MGTARATGASGAAFALLLSMALGLPAQAAAQAAPRFVDIFAVRTWLPPPPPEETPAATAPAEPQAPALPFRFLGRIVEPGKPAVFLLIEGNEVIAARVGEAIGKSYRLERYAGGQLVFLYRPLKTRQTLSVGE